mgnify:CR=1 FL=1
MRRLLLWIICLPGLLLAQNESMPALPLTDLSAFKATGTGGNWQIVGGVQTYPGSESLETTPGTGVLVNQPSEGQRSNLITQMEHGDLDLSLEFMMAPHSNSGIYLMGRYEIQLLDSWGKARPTFGDCGGVYQRWDESQPEGQRGYQGHAPRLNAARAPGLWQKLEISFQAPRFDDAGRKVQNARLLSVRLNDALIHQNIELTGPTRGPLLAEEGPTGPLLIQGDHGAVAFRNLRYQSYAQAQASVGPLDYAVYLKKFQGIPSAEGESPARTGQTDIFTQEVAGESQDFLLTLQGTLVVPHGDTYQLEMNALGFGQLLIDGEEVFPMQMWRQQTELELSAGEHQLEIHYAKDAAWYNNGLALYLSSSQMRRHPLHVLSSMPVNKPTNPIYAAVDGNRPRILRSFIDYGQGEARRRIVHAINVGLPQGLAYTFDPDQAAVLQLWKGGFLDATPMWLSRGDGSARPQGAVLPLGDRPGLALLLSEQAEWPEQLPEDYDFQGYEIDEAGQPIFRYALAGEVVRDRLLSSDLNQVTREIVLPAGLQQTLYFYLGEAETIEKLGADLYHFDQRYFVRLDSGEPLLRDTEAGKQLLLKAQGGQTVSYEVLW